MNQYIHWVDFIVTRFHFSCKLSDSEETVFLRMHGSRLQNHQVPFSSKLTDWRKMNQYIHWVDFIVTRFHSLYKLSDSEETVFTHSWNRPAKWQGSIFIWTNWFGGKWINTFIELTSLSPGSILLQIIWFWGSCFYALHGTGFKITRFHFPPN